MAAYRRGQVFLAEARGAGTMEIGKKRMAYAAAEQAFKQALTEIARCLSAKEAGPDTVNPEELTAEINSRWGDVVNDITEVTVSPKKTDVYVNLFGVAWMPYYIVQTDADKIELPAFGAG